MKLILAVPPTTEPVTLAELKAHVAVAHDHDDALLAAHLSAARDAVEKATGLFLAPAEYDIFTMGSAYLPVHPLTQVVSVHGISPNADDPPVATTFDYNPISEFLTIDTPAWPVLRYVARVRVGMAAEMVPPALKSAIKLIASDLYDSRGAVVIGTIATDNPTVARLIFPYRHNLGV